MSGLIERTIANRRPEGMTAFGIMSIGQLISMTGTGMTRFATFWVENGEIQAPLNAMRFDETLYRLLGENLLGLTAERDFLLDPSTYHARSTSSFRVPGALVEGFRFTL